jgi:hypothetical protein
VNGTMNSGVTTGITAALTRFRMPMGMQLGADGVQVDRLKRQIH